MSQKWLLLAGGDDANTRSFMTHAAVSRRPLRAQAFDAAADVAGRREVGCSRSTQEDFRLFTRTCCVELRDECCEFILQNRRAVKAHACWRTLSVERAHHVRRGDCALERGGTFGSARDETRLERLVFVFKGESEKLQVIDRVYEAIGAFFLQKCSQRLIGQDK